MWFKRKPGRSCTTTSGGAQSFRDKLIFRELHYETPSALATCQKTHLFSVCVLQGSQKQRARFSWGLQTIWRYDFLCTPLFVMPIWLDHCSDFSFWLKGVGFLIDPQKCKAVCRRFNNNEDLGRAFVVVLCHPKGKQQGPKTCSSTGPARSHPNSS